MHAQNVWLAFNCQSLGDYVKLYMKTDVLLLTDIFENFREQCLNAYKLDPVHYYTTSGLTWDAMLKYTQIRLELLTDVDKLMFVERGIRGGISQCCNRYAKANNPYMDVYDENQDQREHILTIAKFIQFMNSSQLFHQDIRSLKYHHTSFTFQLPWRQYIIFSSA